MIYLVMEYCARFKILGLPLFPQSFPYQHPLAISDNTNITMVGTANVLKAHHHSMFLGHVHG